MAKPKTMSEPFQIRVPLDLWPLLEHNAAKYDRTVPQHVQQRLIEALELQYAKSDVPVVGGYDGDCGHPRAKVINGGLLHCDECGSTRGVDNQWRAKTGTA